MCGIVGYIGKDDALINLKSKIKLLEYRGYDSSGLCVIDSKTKNFYIKKTVGTIDKIKDLKKLILLLALHIQGGLHMEK